MKKYKRLQYIFWHGSEYKIIGILYKSKLYKIVGDSRIPFNVYKKEIEVLK
jgi:NH3-dependent NAD+ synthetase